MRTNAEDFRREHLTNITALGTHIFIYIPGREWVDK